MKMVATVRRTGYSQLDIELEIPDEHVKGMRRNSIAFLECVRAAAVDAAGNHSFSEHSSDYELVRFRIEPDVPRVCDACKGRGFLLQNNDKHGLRIEKCDACDKFSSDKAAVEAAYKLAGGT